MVQKCGTCGTCGTKCGTNHSLLEKYVDFKNHSLKSQKSSND